MLNVKMWYVGQKGCLLKEQVKQGSRGFFFEMFWHSSQYWIILKMGKYCVHLNLGYGFPL